MEDNPYRPPANFEGAKGSWLDVIGPGWWFPLTVGGGLGLGALDYCLDNMGIDQATADRIGFTVTAAWIVSMLVGGIIVGNLKNRRQRG